MREKVKVHFRHQLSYKSRMLSIFTNRSRFDNNWQREISQLITEQGITDSIYNIDILLNFTVTVLYIAVKWMWTTKMHLHVIFAFFPGITMSVSRKWDIISCANCPPSEINTLCIIPTWQKKPAKNNCTIRKKSFSPRGMQRKKIRRIIKFAKTEKASKKCPIKCRLFGPVGCKLSA